MSQKIALDLQTPSKDHWTITLDQIYPRTLEESWHQCEAKQAARVQEARSKEAEVSHSEATTSREPPEPETRDSGREIPAKTAPSREQVLGTTKEILDRVHALHLQTMQKMESMHEIDRTLAQTLMAELARLQLIVNEDLTRSLVALHADIEASCTVLVSDITRIMGLHPNDSASCQVKSALWKFQQITSLKVTLPLTELEAACEDMEAFMQGCLQELSSQSESREHIEKLTQQLTSHTSRVRELVQDPELAEGEVSQ